MSLPLLGRAALITGASQGLGLAIARGLLRDGADVFLCARDQRTLEEARADLELLAGSSERVRVHRADVSREADVAALTSGALEAFPHIEILVNNAGVYGPMGPIDQIDWAEWVSAIEINLLGSVLMCRALVPHLKARGRGKIIQVSGGGATSPLPFISAYAASKAAVVRFAETLAQELQPFNIDVNSVAPGALNTRLLDQVLAAGPAAVGASFYDRALTQQKEGGSSLERAADLCAFLAGPASDGISGKLISAVWDPWESFVGLKSQLEQTDVYTLRRIVPKDRGKTWGEP